MKINNDKFNKWLEEEKLDSIIAPMVYFMLDKGYVIDKQKRGYVITNFHVSYTSDNLFTALKDVIEGVQE